MRTIVVVGGSLAGIEAARSLRRAGFDGRLTIVGAEEHEPYDRPPLSKGYLAGIVAAADLALSADSDDHDLVLGRIAVALRAHERAVELDDGTTVAADGVVLATGASARTLPGHAPAGVHILRTRDDADRIRAELVAGSRLIVVGGGFIGGEVAATAVGLGMQVCVVEAQPVPLLDRLGPLLAVRCAELHRRNGVELVCGATVGGFHGDRRVRGVRLGDGRMLPADVVVVGIGSVPNTGWLDRIPRASDGGVRCDAQGATGLPGIVAAGDCASWAGPDGRHRRAEHWTAATRQADIAARRLLAGRPVDSTPELGYVWSDVHGERIQLAGRCTPDLEHTVVTGTLDGPGPLALAFRDSAGVIRGAACVSSPKQFGRLRREVAAAL